MEVILRRGMVVYMTDEFYNKEAVFLEGNMNYIKKGPRPYIIVQNDVGNRHIKTITVVPVTEKTNHADQPTRCIVDLKNPSTVMGEYIKTVNATDIKTVVGMVTRQDMERIDACLAYELGLIDVRKLAEVHQHGTANKQ